MTISASNFDILTFYSPIVLCFKNDAPVFAVIARELVTIFFKNDALVSAVIALELMTLSLGLGGPGAPKMQSLTKFFSLR